MVTLASALGVGRAVGPAKRPFTVHHVKSDAGLNPCGPDVGGKGIDTLWIYLEGSRRFADGMGGK